MRPPVWRNIKSRDHYIPRCSPRGGYAVQLTLECGHLKHYKGSKEPKRGPVRCHECELKQD